jgi:hypothetical protein
LLATALVFATVMSAIRSKQRYIHCNSLQEYFLLQRSLSFDFAQLTVIAKPLGFDCRLIRETGLFSALQESMLAPDVAIWG